MINVTQTYASLGRKAVADAYQYATLWVDGIGRLLDVQRQAARTALEQQAQTLDHLLGTGDGAEAIRDAQRLIDSGVEGMIDSMRKTNGIMLELQNNLQDLARKGIETLGEDVRTGFDVMVATQKEVAESVKAPEKRKAA